MTQERVNMRKTYRSAVRRAASLITSLEQMARGADYESRSIAEYDAYQILIELFVSVAHLDAKHDKEDR